MAIGGIGEMLQLSCKFHCGTDLKKGIIIFGVCNL